MELKLKGRTAFVTGASRGIGRAIAIALAAEGVHLALFGRDVARCEALAHELRTAHDGLRVVVVSLDLGQPAAIKPAVATAIGQMGGVDILVNCAGGAYRGRLNDIPGDISDLAVFLASARSGMITGCAINVDGGRTRGI